MTKFSELLLAEAAFYLLLADLLRAEEPVIAVESAFYAFHSVLCHTARTCRRNNHFVSRTPVGRKRYAKVVVSLQADKHTLDFVEVAAK